MAKFKITVDQTTCIGCAACTAVSPNFKMVEGDEAKAVPVKEDVDELKENEIEAKDTCPVNAIKIEEKEE